MGPVLYAPDQTIPDQKLYKLLLIDGVAFANYYTTECFVSCRPYLFNSISMCPVLYAPNQAVPDQKLYKLLLIDGWLSLIATLQNALSVVAHIFFI